MRRGIRKSLGAVTIVMLLTAASTAEAASPSLSSILPRGVERDAEHVLSFRGNRLADAKEIFFYEPGFEVVKLEAKKDRVDATVRVSPDCRLGEHTAQVRTASGISDYRTFYVGALPAVAEKEPNGDFEKPQPLDLNVTVDGVVKREDVDYFAVEAKKGQRISVEIEAMRLGSAMFDPYVAILDTDRFELAAADDTRLVHQDAVASIVAPQDGKYIIEVHESAYGGSGNSRYRLHVGTFPRPTAVFPPGGKIGSETEVRFLGDPAGDITKKVQLPDQPDDGFALFASDDGGTSPSPVPFRLFEHDNLVEQEPNNARDKATSAQLPLAFNGVISEPGDVDWYRFEAKKGQTFEVECYARRIRSPLDSVMVLYNDKGKRLKANDDSRGPDSYFRYSFPADGQYALQLTDHRRRGDADFVYRVEFQDVTPQLSLSIPRVKRYSQYRQTISVPKGNRYATLMTARRRNFRGDLVLEPDQLPEGMTMVAEMMPANMNVMPVLFEASAEAPVAGRLVDLIGKDADPKKHAQGRFENSADLIRSGPGQSIYWKKQVDRLATAVVEAVPFKLKIVEPKVPLVRNGSMQLKIVAERDEGFDEAIRVEFPFRPPGVSAKSAINIPKGKNEVLYPLNANSKARIGEFKVFAVGSANVNGAAWASSQLARLEIAEPYVQFVMKRTAVEKGQETQIFCTLTHNTEFEGKAKARLLGLPNKVAALELEFTHGTKELTFDVSTDAASPAGKHKNVFCQVIVPESGQSVVHRTVGATELRIDNPPPEPKDQPKQPKKKVAKKEPAKKALSRLEKLRLEAKQRREAEAVAEGDASSK